MHLMTNLQLLAPLVKHQGCEGFLQSASPLHHVATERQRRRAAEVAYDVVRNPSSTMC